MASTSAPQETDTCRICRGEGSAEEPLFHPCKCSGSIMYVHQDCLMEWLSHSQKKHCELCKTSFTFTKLYHPDMPSALPTGVFMRKAAAHIITRILYWARGTLVALTWLFWLPWTMRFVWWGLFFLADMDWTHDVEFQEGGLVETRHNSSAPPAPNDFRLPGMLGVMTWFIKISAHHGSSGDDAAAIDANNMTASLLRVRSRATLLSGVPFFKNAALDRITTDILEGLIITVALVATIVLILLIREWVVQQQPIINMVADEQGPNPVPQAAQIHNAPANDEIAPPPMDGTNDEDGDAATSTPGTDGESEHDYSKIHVDPTLADFDNVEKLLATVADSNTNGSLKHFRRGDLQQTSPQDNGPHFELKHRMGALLISVHETHIAVVQDFENVEMEENTGKLRECLRKITRLEDVLEYLSDKERDALAPLIQATKDRINNAVQIASTGEDAPQTGSSSAVPRPVSSEDVTQSRPIMPQREESSIANDIQRRLQEHAPPETGSEPQKSSSNSEKSWQEIERPANESSQYGQNGLAMVDQSSDDMAPPYPDLPQENTANPVVEMDTLPAPFPSSSNSTQISTLPDSLQLPNNVGPTSDDDAMDETIGTDQGQVQEHSRPWYGYIIDWLWGDITPHTPQTRGNEDNEHVVANLADEEPFVRVDQHHNEAPAPADVNQEQALGRPALIPNEAELVEEAEDLEGVMELIGMQGPLTGLFTNAIFAAVFVSCTTSLSIWLPFLLGKVILVWIAHPVSLGEALFKGASSAVNVLLDFCIFGIAWGAQWVLNVPLNWVSAWKGFTNDRYATPVVGPLATWTITVLDQSYGRMAAEITKTVRASGVASSHMTLDSHAALAHIKMQTTTTINNTAALAMHLRQQLVSSSGISIQSAVMLANCIVRQLGTSGLILAHSAKQLPSFILSGRLTISYASHSVDPPAQTEPAVWSALDRSLTIGIGYAALVALAALYYSHLAPVASSREGRKIENTVLEILQQTGGVAKVVLIISIEMLAFPLYCGLLLDIAMLPLFGSASIESRLSFTIGSPWTSIFVHWFIGTCYMFHFALFVAMCRKILRKGVLYFIRDPDDPTFHPVRDVLERSVISQLRKIMSSALIYGGLVIVCLGSILWLLAYGISGVLPIRWSADNNYFGFPVDLLLYTSLKPLLVRFLTPSDWLHKAYEWWFRRTARVLCLSHYLFGEDNQDERGAQGPRTEKGSAQQMAGRWVRVPGNDQVRIGRGRLAWTDVDERNHRRDGVHEPTDVEGIGPNDTNFAKVYIPPHFRLRITLFFASLWALTAGAGFLLTVLPLLCGRSLFALMLPRDLWANDIYAFTVGLIVMCGAAFVAVQSRKAVEVPSLSASGVLQTMSKLWNKYAATMSARTRMSIRCFYVYGVTAIVMPCIVALLSEFYLLAPLHTLMSDGKEAHTIQLLRSWTLGVQYVRIFISIIQWSQDSKPARALRAIVARGYLDPNAGKATRYFFLPVTVAGALAMLLPMPLGALAARVLCDADDEAQQRIYRGVAYPVLMGTVVVFASLRWILRLLHGWRMRIRDETYLVGERLHNYGESSSAPQTRVYHRDIT